MTMEIKELRNGLFALFSDNVVCVNTWGAYFTDKKFDNEPELRNKISVLWLASLFDSLEGEMRMLGKYEQAANELSQIKLVTLCGKAREFVETVKEVIGLYSREEQLFIRDLRDQWVHSWLARRHRESFDIKFYNGSSMVVERMTRDAYYSIVGSFFETRYGLDSVLKPLVERATKGKLRYWNAIDLLNRQMPLLHQAIIEGIDVDIR